MALINKKIDKVVIRMYCMGTGDCFVLKFSAGRVEKYTMMIDCGSYSGTVDVVRPYLEDLLDYIGERGIDLLVVTHEHQDHVNGFQKCKDIFENLDIRDAWFGWPENPEDPLGRSGELLKKRNKLRLAFSMARDEYQKRIPEIENSFAGDHNFSVLKKSNEAFMSGLASLANINLPADGDPKSEESLAGMVAIRDVLQKKGIEIKYKNPGDIIRPPEAPGLAFYILGPPWNPDAVYKDGKEGTDVYTKHLSLNRNVYSADAYCKIGNELSDNDLPFDNQYTVDMKEVDMVNRVPGLELPYRSYVRDLLSEYTNTGWRKIDYDWITGVGTLALRLNSHLNNTSLALAIESEDTGKVLLFPGDAEYGNWESWQLIKQWEKKGKDKKPLAEDLLNRTVFYKVGHHLSYNGTALEKGINMMPTSNLAAMASLDRKRISVQWKSTMPNKYLLQDLINRCEGKVFIMSEKEIENPPSKKVNPRTFGKSYMHDDRENRYIQYTMDF
jgi:hypothetical protein